jgi:hypothetical protein
MKIHRVTLLLIFGLFITSCEKKLFNYRNKYLGDWEFKVNVYEHNIDSLGSQFNDSFIYQGQIKYGVNDDELLIEYSNDDVITLKINTEGEVTTNLGFGTCTFDNNEDVEIHLKWGGMGAFIIHDINGVKQ